MRPATRVLVLCAAALLVMVLAGCSSAHGNQAEAKPDKPPCGADGGCFEHHDFAWGYCHYQTLQSPEGKTFSGSLEIGIRKNISNPSESMCTIDLAFGGEITAINGTVSYKSYTGKHFASMVADLRACAVSGCPYPRGQEHLMSVKLLAEPNQSTHVSYGMRFDTPIKARRLLLVFNDDLAEAKPTSISVAFVGTLK
jgi:hypothetical protein